MDRTGCDRSDRSRHLRGLTTSSPRSGQAAICCPYRSVSGRSSRGGEISSPHHPSRPKPPLPIASLDHTTECASSQRGLPHLSRSAQRLFEVDFHTRARGVDSVRLKGTRFKLWAVPALRTIGVDPRAGAPVPGRRGGRAHTQVTPPEGNPHRTSDTLEQEIVELRKHLADEGPGRRRPHDRRPPHPPAPAHSGRLDDLAGAVAARLRHPLSRRSAPAARSCGSRP